MKAACILALGLVLSSCDLQGRARCRETLFTVTALQAEVNDAEATAKKPDAAAFEAALARVEAAAAAARSFTNVGNEKFRVQSADYTRREFLKSLPATVEALKKVNARVVENADPAAIRAASRSASGLIDASVGLVKGQSCDG